MTWLIPVAIAVPTNPNLGVNIRLSIILVVKAANELKNINFVFLCKDSDTISNGTNVEIKKPMAKIDRAGIAGKYFTPKIILIMVPGKDNRISKRKKLKASIHFAICFVIISTDLISPLAK